VFTNSTNKSSEGDLVQAKQLYNIDETQAPSTEIENKKNEEKKPR
jgi:hypothetical protein